MNFKLYTLFFAAFVLSSTLLHAQPKDRERLGSTIGLSAHLRYVSFDVDGINTYLEEANLPKLKDGGLMFAADFIFLPDTAFPLYSDIVFGGFSSSSRENGLHSNMLVSDVAVNLNYILFCGPRHYITPGIGFGMLGYNYQVRRDAAIGTDFQTALASLQGEQTLKSELNYYINFRLAYDWAIRKRGDLMLGVEAGYRLGIYDQKWLLANKELGNAPRGSADGFFVGIVFAML